jgi:hypothetical protein
MQRFRKLFDVLRFLYLQRVKGLTPPSDEPLMDQKGIERFKREVARAKAYVEFGSGGSTVFVDCAGIPGVSVENDPYYARAVASRLKGGRITQRVVAMGLTQPWGVPWFPKVRWAKAYVSAPWDIASFPDFVLVDGRYRVACALEAARRAQEASARATLMFADYVSRPHYHPVERHLGPPELVGNEAIFRIGLHPVTEADLLPWLQDWR